MSFILDALRKSEHERQRSASPSLSHVPLATPEPQLPRWALALIALLAVTVLTLAAAWWQSSRSPARAPLASPPPVVERPLALPAAGAPATPAAATAPAPAASAARPPRSIGDSRALADVADTVPNAPLEAAARGAAAAAPEPAATLAATLPSAASLMSEGIALPPLRLELHAYAEQPSARFVFINGRKYGEGERLADGPELVAIEPQGAVLSYSGRRFLLRQE